jgi:hypothetical protein
VNAGINVGLDGAPISNSQLQARSRKSNRGMIISLFIADLLALFDDQAFKIVPTFWVNENISALSPLLRSLRREDHLSEVK